MSKILNINEVNETTEQKLNKLKHFSLASFQLLFSLATKEVINYENMIIEFDKIKKIISDNKISNININEIPECLKIFDIKILMMYMFNEQMILINQIQF